VTSPLRPAVDHEPAWQVVVLAHGRVVRDACSAALREALMRPSTLVEASRNGVVRGDWVLFFHGRAGVAAAIAAPLGTEESVARAYLRALVDAYAPSAFEPFVPPDPRGGGSPAPALIAAYTPSRAN
jgi:hypothetical protein